MASAPGSLPAGGYVLAPGANAYVIESQLRSERRRLEESADREARLIHSLEVRARVGVRVGVGACVLASMKSFLVGMGRDRRAVCLAAPIRAPCLPGPPST